MQAFIPYKRCSPSAVLRSLGVIKRQYLHTSATMVS